MDVHLAMDHEAEHDSEAISRFTSSVSEEQNEERSQDAFGRFTRYKEVVVSYKADSQKEKGLKLKIKFKYLSTY